MLESVRVEAIASKPYREYRNLYRIREVSPSFMVDLKQTVLDKAWRTLKRLITEMAMKVAKGYVKSIVMQIKET